MIGIGYGLINTPVSAVAVSTLPSEQAGVAAATASSSRNIGLVMGIAVLGTVVNERLPGLRAHESYAHRIHRCAPPRLHGRGRA